MPMRLDEGWNQIQFNLSDFTRRAYGTNYIETLRYVSNSRALFKFIARLKFCNDYSFTPFCRVQIHANCRIRRIYFSDRLYTEDELPPEFKLFLPVAGKPQGGQQMWAQSASAHQSRLGWIDKKRSLQCAKYRLRVENGCFGEDLCHRSQCILQNFAQFLALTARPSSNTDFKGSPKRVESTRLALAKVT